MDSDQKYIRLKYIKAISNKNLTEEEKEEVKEEYKDSLTILNTLRERIQQQNNEQLEECV